MSNTEVYVDPPARTLRFWRTEVKAETRNARDHVFHFYDVITIAASAAEAEKLAWDHIDGAVKPYRVEVVRDSTVEVVADHARAVAYEGV